MVRGVRWYLVGFVLLGSLGVLAGCSGGRFWAEREPWRREAEIACLNSGAVGEGAGKVRMAPISGPGACGADFPLKVSALGEGVPLAFGDDLRPPSSIPSASLPPRWPTAPYERAPPYRSPAIEPDRWRHDQPLSLDPRARSDDPYDYRRPSAQPPAARPPVRPVGPVSVTPAATLACPLVSALDQWVAAAVQPSALRWFGQPVVEIRQISAYSCRGMNGNPNARISEHAFGNALDIASFTLADGRTIAVKSGWRGAPAEQGFLRDVQGSACDRFTTVLAPGSDVHHYDHIHVDLMRRASGHRACNPRAMAGEEAAARARHVGRRGDAGFTGSVTPQRQSQPRMPFAVPGEDGQD